MCDVCKSMSLCIPDIFAHRVWNVGNHGNSCCAQFLEGGGGWVGAEVSEEGGDTLVLRLGRGSSVICGFGPVRPELGGF